MSRTLLIAALAGAALAAGATGASAATIGISDTTVTEGSGGAGGTAQLTVGVGQTAGEGGVSWSLSTSSGSASSGADFGAPSTTSGSVPACAGPGPGACSSGEMVTIPIVGDDLDEDDESFTVTVQAAGATTGTSVAHVKINDDDDPPKLEVDGDKVTEGNSGSHDAKVDFDLSRPSGKDVTVHYETNDGTATQGSDYAFQSGTVHIPAGETEAHAHIPVFGDTTFEPDEDFHVHAFDATNAVLDDDGAGMTILNDDAPPPPPPPPPPPSNNHPSTTTPGSSVVTVTGQGTALQQQQQQSGANSNAAADDETGPHMRIAFAGLVRHGHTVQLRLKLTCPRSEQRCSVNLRTRAADHQLGSARFVLDGGQTATVRLPLTKQQRRWLHRSEELSVRAVARDAAGNSEATLKSFAV